MVILDLAAHQGLSCLLSCLEGDENNGREQEGTLGQLHKTPIWGLLHKTFYTGKIARKFKVLVCILTVFTNVNEVVY